MGLAHGGGRIHGIVVRVQRSLGFCLLGYRRSSSGTLEIRLSPQRCLRWHNQGVSTKRESLGPRGRGRSSGARGDAGDPAGPARTRAIQWDLETTPTRLQRGARSGICCAPWMAGSTAHREPKRKHECWQEADSRTATSKLRMGMTFGGNSTTTLSRWANQHVSRPRGQSATEPGPGCCSGGDGARRLLRGLDRRSLCHDPADG